MTLVKGLVEDLFEDIADVTLIDEDTKPILTDDDNKEIPSNMTMHVASPSVQISFLVHIHTHPSQQLSTFGLSSPLRQQWSSYLLMQVAPPGGLISY